MDTLPARRHTVIGVFRSGLHAFVALRGLDRAGLSPRDITLIAGEPDLDAEARALPHAPKGAIAGAAMGVVIGAGYVIFGGSGLFADILGVFLGLAVAAAAGIAGFLLGRTIARRVSRWRDYERVVSEGGAIVTVACADQVCDQAKDVLKASGAVRIVDEAA
ncbi:MAG TPA: hypothetical protein VFM93_13565 [Candidatus Limnocylindria bacterium]|nr:hypothetical protein [Candidatus Limnocylindria bacterium]